MEKAGFSDDGFSGVPVFQVLVLALVILNNFLSVSVLPCQHLDLDGTMIYKEQKPKWILEYDWHYLALCEMANLAMVKIWCILCMTKNGNCVAIYYHTLTLLCLSLLDACLKLAHRFTSSNTLDLIFIFWFHNTQLMDIIVISMICFFFFSFQKSLSFGINLLYRPCIPRITITTHKYYCCFGCSILH